MRLRLTSRRSVFGTWPMANRRLGAAITIAVYRVTVTGKESSASQVRTALESLVGSGSLTVQRKGKDKVFDLARSLPKEARVGDKDGGSEVDDRRPHGA